MLENLREQSDLIEKAVCGIVAEDWLDFGMDMGFQGRRSISSRVRIRSRKYWRPYLEGYKYGFLLRKAGVTERGKMTEAQSREEQRLWRLMEVPMYPQPWEKVA